MTIIDQAELHRRIIEPNEFVADTEAFVDVRLERSRGKASYSFIGPGVSQNAGQTINLREPHGFNVGAASMPHGVVNNAHLHYTAEVFVCTRGSFRMTIGRHGEQTVDLAPGDVFAAPPWVFRGFVNTGPDDSFVFVVLGGDDTGGIIWSPDVLREAAATGLHLGPQNSLIDTNAGDDPSDAIQPIADEHLAAVDAYTDDELESHVVPGDDRVWTSDALLSGVLDGHACELAPVLGHGLAEDRHVRPPVAGAHGFSIEWLRIAPGSTTGVHRIAESQVLLLADGDWQIGLNRGAERLDAKPATGSVVSVPPGTWREFTNAGSMPAVAAVVCGGDAPNRIEWSAELVEAARARGWVHDAAGKLAPVQLLPGGRT